MNQEPMIDSEKRPQQDSNLRTRLRRPLLYPLSYGGWHAESPEVWPTGRSKSTSFHVLGGHVRDLRA